MDFVFFSRLQSKNEKIDKYLDLVRELKKLLNIKVLVIPILAGTLGMVHKGLDKRLEELKIRKKNQDHTDCKHQIECSEES